MIWIILTGIFLSLITPFLGRLKTRPPFWILVLFPLGTVVYLIQYLGVSEPILYSVAWVPSLGVSLSFKMDGLSQLFSLIISLIGVMVYIYSGSYLKDTPHIDRFFSFLTLFMTSMLGLVWADNLISLFVFWELTSISSYLLIGFEHQHATARKAALQALLVTGGGGLAFLAGIVLMGQITGTYEISQITISGNLIRQSRLYPLILTLVLAGAFTKSAQFPFHFWLPGAMAAPTPVSAYLHSATMVKAGIYLLARLYPVLAGTELWQVSLTTFGLATFILGAFAALPQTDLKKILAYSTVASLGLLVFLLGLDRPLAIKTALTYLIAHSLYKGSLFLIAGSVDHAAHSRNINELGGLWKKMPWSATAGALAGISAIGLIPSLGFIAKELVYELSLSHPAMIQTIILFCGFALITAASAWAFILPFWGRKANPASSVVENPAAIWAPPLFLGALGVLLSLTGPQVGTLLIQPAAASILQNAQKISLYLWHGFSPVFMISLGTLLAGLLLFWARQVIQPIAQRIDMRVSRFGPQQLFDFGLEGLKKAAFHQTRILQNGYLRFYLMTIILATIGMVGMVVMQNPGSIDFPQWETPRFYDFVLIGVILAAVAAVVSSTSRLATVAYLGCIGFTIALLYLLFGAPDLAMVQFAIETLAVILFILVVYRLPKFTLITSPKSRIKDITVAAAAGGMMSLLVLWIASQPFTSHLTPYFVENSLPLAKGRNIVNVILVDFRGFDTLGEVSVLSIAAIGVFALVELNIHKDLLPTKRIVVRKVRSMVLPTAVRYLLPLLLIFSVFLLLRGHNEVGGGFVAGLVAASALMLYAIAISPEALLRLLPASPRYLIACGLLVALISGTIGLFLGAPYMTGLWITEAIPAFGKVGTPVLFDIGIYVVVIGVCLHILVVLAEDD